MNSKQASQTRPFCPLPFLGSHVDPLQHLLYFFPFNQCLFLRNLGRRMYFLHHLFPFTPHHMPWTIICAFVFNFQLKQCLFVVKIQEFNLNVSFFLRTFIRFLKCKMWSWSKWFYVNNLVVLKHSFPLCWSTLSSLSLSSHYLCNFFSCLLAPSFN
jgi:hypothetical protein